MRGIDCTPEQLEVARQFILGRVIDAGAAEQARALGDETQITHKFGDLVRLVAWYGAMRYVAGRDGTGGTFECPGVVDSVEARRGPELVRP